MQWSVSIGSKVVVVQLPDSIPDNSEFDGMVDGKSVKLRWQRQTRTLFVLNTKSSGGWTPINARSRTVTKFPGDGEVAVNVEFSVVGSNHPLNLEASVTTFLPGSDSKEGGKKKKSAVIRSQITGKVLKVLVKPGDNVSTGDTLMIIEAMKMENRVLSNTNGIIDSVKVKESDTVSSGAELLKFK